MKFAKEIRLGVIVTAALGALIWGLNFLKGHNIFTETEEYYAVYDRIDGLVAADPVQIKGFVVGQVKKIYFHPEDNRKIIVIIRITGQKVKIPVDSRAKIFSYDLLGSKAIEIVAGEENIYILPGDTLPTEIEEDIKEAVNRTIAPLKLKTEQLLASVDSAVTIVKTILDKDARENLGKGFKSIQRSFENFEIATTILKESADKNKYRLDDIFIKVQNITTLLNNNTDNLTNIFTNLSAVTDSMARADFAVTFNKVNKTMLDISAVMTKINNGEGTLGLLIKDTKLYNELTIAAADFNILMLDMRLNPGKYAPLKRRKEEKPLVRDSIYYKNMMKMDSVIMQMKISD